MQHSRALCNVLRNALVEYANGRPSILRFLRVSLLRNARCAFCPPLIYGLTVLGHPRNYAKCVTGIFNMHNNYRRRRRRRHLHIHIIRNRMILWRTRAITRQHYISAQTVYISKRTAFTNDAKNKFRIQSRIGRWNVSRRRRRSRSIIFSFAHERFGIACARSIGKRVYFFFFFFFPRYVPSARATYFPAAVSLSLSPSHTRS